jgi:hypothetical protein
MMNLISYCDGRTLLDIADVIGEPMWDLLDLLPPLIANGLIEAKPA